MIVSTENNQTTISKKISLKGVGLHTGKDVTLTFVPSTADIGYVFKRVDLENSPTIQADIKYVSSTDRGTCLNKNGLIIQTCEHVLAALVGSEIDNVILAPGTGGSGVLPPPPPPPQLAMINNKEKYISKRYIS